MSSNANADNTSSDQFLTLMNSPFVRAYNANKPEIVKLYSHMEQYIIDPEDTQSPINFICTNPEYMRRYKVPSDAIPAMMEFMLECFNAGIPNQILECQYSNANKVSSLFFDFEFETKEQFIDFDSVIGEFSKLLFNIFTNCINLPDDESEHYMFYLKTINPLYIIDKNKYKSKFRMLVPSIMLSSEHRLCIYNRIRSSKNIHSLFEDKLNYKIGECLKTNVRNAPITMIGSYIYGEENAPMKLETVYSIKVSRLNSFSYCAMPVTFDKTFKNIILEA